MTDFDSLDIVIPKDFARYDADNDEQDAGLRQRLDTWKLAVETQLEQLRDSLESLSAIEDQANVVASAASFDADDDDEPWTSSTSRRIAQDILSNEPYSSPSEDLLVYILTHKIKPIFAKNPHPSLNLNTGRKLPRPAGGPMATQDQYDSQIWKDHPGAANLVKWCLKHIQSTQYERLWHLIVPPMMAFLDDFEATYKLKGVKLASEMLRTVPGGLLKRTGVDTLMHTSLTNCTQFINDPKSAQLIRTSVPVMLTLIELTTKQSSAQRFDMLCSLLGEGIIGTIWLYASSDVAVMQASTDVLPLVIQALGIGTTRYLKALIPELTQMLAPDILKPLQLSSSRALQALILECPAERIRRWKGTIIAGVAKAWTMLADLPHTTEPDTGYEELKTELKKTVSLMRDRCGDDVENEFMRLKELDSALFNVLLIKG